MNQQIQIKKTEGELELKKILLAAALPLVLIFIMVAIKSLELGLDASFYKLGVLPKKAYGLIGVLTSPLVHKDFDHLYHNALALLVLGTMFVYFHKNRAFEIFFALYIISGFWLWMIGRPVYHIGASGVVYALAAFHVSYGFVIRNPQMLAISFLVILFYGAMIWYVLPIKDGMSWEAHLCGALSGIAMAIYYGNMYKKSLLEVRGSMIFSSDEQFGEKVNYTYFYKETKKD